MSAVRSTLTWLTLGLGLALLAGCAPAPIKPVTAWQAPDWPVWSLHGRIAVRHGEDGWHAALDWRQTPDGYRLDLSGPLGQGALRLAGNAEGVTLTRADGSRDWAASADELLARHTGWRLPVAGIRYWARGVAAPGSTASIEHDPAGRPVRLQQSGWDIRYSQYQDYPGLGNLPRRIDFQRADLSARLIIDRWVPGEGGG